MKDIQDSGGSASGNSNRERSGENPVFHSMKSRICASLSVILPNFNHSNFLKKALEDILAQSVQPAEIIVVDDGSTDASVSIIEAIARVAPTIKVLRNDVNRGIAYSIDRALEASSGNYIYFAGADDLIYPGLFEQSLDLLERFPNAGLCSSGVESLEPNGFRTKAAIEDISSEACYIAPEKCLMLLRRRGSWMGGCTTMYRRDAYVAAGGYRAELGPFCDIFLQMVVSLQHGVCFNPDCMGAQRLYESSYSARDKAKSYLFEEIYRVAANLMVTEYGQWFPIDFVSQWKRRAIYLARLSGLRTLQNQQLAAMKNVFTTMNVGDRLAVGVMRVGMQLHFLIFSLYLFMRLDEEMRFVLKNGIRLGVRRLPQRLRSWV